MTYSELNRLDKNKNINIYLKNDETYTIYDLSKEKTYDKLTKKEVIAYLHRS